MLHLYTWNTPNGIKPLIMLEETGLDYRVHPVDISTGAQKSDAFLSMNPNGRIPAMIDDGQPGDARMDEASGLGIFESGAILVYCARLARRFLPEDPVQQSETLGWTFWQVGHLGPMVGQLHWFDKNDPDSIGTERYGKETERLLDILDRRLSDRDYLAGDYSIADMMCWAWAKAGREASDGTRAALDAWIDRIGDRPAVQRAQEIAEGLGGKG